MSRAFSLDVVEYTPMLMIIISTLSQITGTAKSLDAGLNVVQELSCSSFSSFDYHRILRF